jgi:hypothetical protein
VQPHLLVVRAHLESRRITLDDERGDPFEPADRSIVAKTVNRSAIGAFVMNVLAPSMT